VCHRKRGTIHQAYRDGMEDRLGALSLVLWTTRYLDAAVDQLRAEDHAIRAEDVARLFPAQAPQPQCARPLQLQRQCAGRRRPLRDPDAPELDEDDDGGQE
jgi:Tn3 transposase DDE domain-containing protein